MALETGKRENTIMLIWIGIYIFVYIIFLPIKGDQFSHIPIVYGYMISTLLLVFGLKFLSQNIGSRLTVKMSALIISFAVLFPVASYLYNGKGHLICNSAEYNYTTVLFLLLDTSNREEVETAIDCAKFGKNQHIVESLINKK